MIMEVMIVMIIIIITKKIRNNSKSRHVEKK